MVRRAKRNKPTPQGPTWNYFTLPEFYYEDSQLASDLLDVHMDKFEDAFGYMVPYAKEVTAFAPSFQAVIHWEKKFFHFNLRDDPCHNLKLHFEHEESSGRRHYMALKSFELSIAPPYQENAFELPVEKLAFIDHPNDYPPRSSPFLPGGVTLWKFFSPFNAETIIRLFEFLRAYSNLAKEKNALSEDLRNLNSVLNTIIIEILYFRFLFRCQFCQSFCTHSYCMDCEDDCAVQII